MPTFRFKGGHPLPDGKGGLVRPGDERDEADLPDFGPWEEIPPEPEPEGEAPAEVTPPATPKASAKSAKTDGEG